jgi:hypothetical protein
MEFADFSEEINNKIEDIKSKILSREISVLDIELVPIFENLKNSLNIYNLNKYSLTYKNAFQLLNQKFEELKVFLNYLDNKDKFLDFLKANPKDREIDQLFDDCWRAPFTIESLSFKFLEYSKSRLIDEKSDPIVIKPIDKVYVKENFLLEIPSEKFTEKMMSFYEKIKRKLPCCYDDIFEDELDQIRIFEDFVYLLHLLQLNLIKYQKETKFLYL